MSNKYRYKIGRLSDGIEECTIYNMELTVEGIEEGEIMYHRVPGGWLCYPSWFLDSKVPFAPVFVPYNDEFEL